MFYWNVNLCFKIFDWNCRSLLQKVLHEIVDLCSKMSFAKIINGWIRAGGPGRWINSRFYTKYKLCFVYSIKQCKSSNLYLKNKQPQKWFLAPEGFIVVQHEKILFQKDIFRLLIPCWRFVIIIFFRVFLKNKL